MRARQSWRSRSSSSGSSAGTARSRRTTGGQWAKTKAEGRAKRGRRLVAFPWAFLVDVCRLTKGQAALATAALVYRRTHVCRSRTVTLPGAELAEIGVDRKEKYKALAILEAAGLIRLEKSGRFLF